MKEDSSNNYFKGSETFATKAGNDQKYVDTTLNGSQTLSYSKSSLTVGNVSYLVGDDTKITLVMRPGKSGGNFTAEAVTMKNNVMTDPAADYEYALATDGDNLDSLFNGYKLTGTLSVIKDSTDSDLADTIVLVVNGVTAI